MRPRAAKKTISARTPVKGKRRKKLKPGDKLRIVLIAAILTAAVSACFLTVVFFHSAQSRNQSPDSAYERPDQAYEQPDEVPASQASPAEIVSPDTTPAEPSPSALSALPAQPVFSAQPAPPVQPALPISRGTLVFVIDDAGHNLRDLEPFLEINEPFTIAVLPGLAYSAEAARRIRAAGKEVFLHQPMEAVGGSNPGPCAILSGMGKDEIVSIVSRNLDEIGPVSGINNHEGSRITMDAETMEILLELCRERGILFLDSRTSSETAASMVARKMGMIIGERDVFVDNVQERESIIGYINAGLLKAEQKGSAIMIGHVWSPLLASLLAELFPDLREQGYTFTPAGTLINGIKL